jgi:hypothetical protein
MHIYIYIYIYNKIKETLLISIQLCRTISWGLLEVVLNISLIYNYVFFIILYRKFALAPF